MLYFSRTLCTLPSLVSSYLIMGGTFDVMPKTLTSSGYHLRTTRDNQQIHLSEDRRMTKICRIPCAGMAGDNLPRISVPP